MNRDNKNASQHGSDRKRGRQSGSRNSLVSTGNSNAQSSNRNRQPQFTDFTRNSRTPNIFSQGQAHPLFTAEDLEPTAEERAFADATIKAAMAAATDTRARLAAMGKSASDYSILAPASPKRQIYDLLALLETPNPGNAGTGGQSSRDALSANPSCSVSTPVQMGRSQHSQAMLPTHQRDMAGSSSQHARRSVASSSSEHARRSTPGRPRHKSSGVEPVAGSSRGTGPSRGGTRGGSAASGSSQPAASQSPTSQLGKRGSKYPRRMCHTCGNTFGINTFSRHSSMCMKHTCQCGFKTTNRSEFRRHTDSHLPSTGAGPSNMGGTGRGSGSFQSTATPPVATQPEASQSSASLFGQRGRKYPKRKCHTCGRMVATCRFSLHSSMCREHVCHCGFKTTSERIFRKHNERHLPDPQRSVICPLCGIGFKAKSNLQNHMNHVHSDR